ncbi:MAG TPA: PQQ-binding-like beta-propeller repeat protein [bacterium]|nr:PQQ-binding-like beta-propeller repeat protein [bacterium]
MKKSLLLIVLALLWCTPAAADELLLNWAVPLKKEFASIKKREYAGLLYQEGHIYAALRNGRLIVFDRAGRKKGERRFSGEFLIPPVATEGGIIVCESNIVRSLKPDLTEQWQVTGKSPVVALPLLRPEGLYLQFSENSIYLVDPSDGAIRANYTFYGENPLSYAMLGRPVVYEDKTAFGFSNGQIIFFLHKKEAASGAEELLPYYKYQTGDTRALLDKKEFYDIFSLLLGAEGTLLFSNGETGGVVRVTDGSVTKRAELRNLLLAELADGNVVGYGEGGALLLAKDGTVLRRLFASDSFVSGYLPMGDRAVFTETGGAVSVWDGQLTEKMAGTIIPQGVSSGAVRGEGAFYVLSDMGVLYSFSVVKNPKVQKILEKIKKDDMKDGSSRISE